MGKKMYEETDVQAIADAIRAKSGGTDTYKLSQMADAVAAISNGGTNGIYMAYVTPETDKNQLDIQHNLGTEDILFAAIFAETLGEISPSFNCTLAKFWAKTDIPVRITSSVNGDNYDIQFGYSTASLNAQGGTITSEIYRDAVKDENTFSFIRSSASGLFISGLTYTVIIVAANAEG